MNAIAQIASTAAVVSGGTGSAGAPALAGLKPGQVLLAQVLGAGADGATRVAIGSRVLDLVLPTPAETGSTIRLQLQGQGADAKFLLLPNLSAPATPALPPASPAALIAQAVPPGPLRDALLQGAQSAIVRQDSLAALVSSLSGLQARPGVLPDPVAAAAAQLLGLRLNTDGKPLTGEALKAAIFKSGILHESALAKGAAPQAQQGDLKAALGALRDTLASWTGAGVAQPTRASTRPVPPLRGAAPRGSGAPAELPEGLSGKDLGRALLEQTEAALSRLRLSQMASLPETHARDGHARAQQAEWQFELPLISGGANGVAQFRISSEDEAQSGSAEARRGWRVQMAVDFPVTGTVHAEVSLRGGVIGVGILAERAETAADLSYHLADLEGALAAQGLTVGKLSCRQGSPKITRHPAGLFMDEVR